MIAIIVANDNVYFRDAENFQVAQTILQASEQRRQLVASEKCEYNTARMMFFIVIGSLNFIYFLWEILS